MTNKAQPGGRDAPADPDPMLGRTLADRYRLDSLLARGGMARVYRARDVRLERDVAVKVLAPPYSGDPAFVERFLAEARVAGSISHPSLVHVYDSGTDGTAHFIVMELLDRHRTLRDVLTQHGRLSPGDVGRIGGDLLAGLGAVHQRGLVHCDVKAANVLLGPGPAKLIDFGIARSPEEAAGGRSNMGTLTSMSPEQLAGRPLTPASDLFSLGTVLYEALTGRPPFPGTTPDEVRARHAAGEIVPPSRIVPEVGATLDGLVLQSLRREPEARFHSAQAMARALAAAMAVESSAADDRPAGSDDETRVVPPAARTNAGYVPPPAPVESRVAPAPSAAARPTLPQRASASRAASRRRGGIGALIGALLVLGMAAAVVAFVVVPLLQLPGPDGSGDPSASALAATARPTVAPDVIPSTVGLPAAEAIAIANEAGLNWVLECDQDNELPEGIIDQEPPAGTQVAPGSRFTMFSARIDDCRGGGDGNGNGNGGGSGDGNGNGRGGG